MDCRIKLGIEHLFFLKFTDLCSSAYSSKGYKPQGVPHLSRLESVIGTPLNCAPLFLPDLVISQVPGVLVPERPLMATVNLQSSSDR